VIDAAVQKASAGKSPGFSWGFATPLVMGASLNPINSSLVATALVPIALSLHVSVGRTAVLVAALYLASSIAQPTSGKLAEELGPRRVFSTGIVLVLIGGIIGASAQNLATLVAARVLVGIGTSAGYPAAIVLIRRRADSVGMDEPPGALLGALSIAGTVTTAVGPPLGGFLVAACGWRWTFLVNVPIAALTLILALAWLPTDSPIGRPRRARDLASRIDAVGIFGFSGAMSALLVFLLGLPSPRWVALGIAVVFALALARRELRVATPFIDVRMLCSNAALTRTYLRGALTLLGTYTVFYGFTQYLEAARGFSAQKAGLLILPMGALAAIVSLPVGRRNLVRGPLIAGAAASLVGSIGLFLMSVHSSIATIIFVTMLFGVAIGTTAVSNQTALYAQAPSAQIGTAAGLYRTFSYVGAIASSAITSIVFRSRVDDHGLKIVAIVLTAVSAVLLGMTLLDRRLIRPRLPTF
jgi:MFS family permease